MMLGFGFLVAPYYAVLAPDQIFTCSTPEGEASAVSINSPANPAVNNGSKGGIITSLDRGLFAMMRERMV
jgi:hypothetical protein